MTRRRFLRRVATGSALLAGCLDAVDSRTGGTPDGTDGGGLPARASVGMGCHDRGEDEYFFSPALVRVERGGTVSWRAASTCRQTCTAYHPEYDRQLRIPEGAAPWRGPDSRDGTVTVTFAVEGVYDYFGAYEQFGQVGSVVVGHPDPDGQPGLRDPGEDVPAAARERLRELNGRARDLLD